MDTALILRMAVDEGKPIPAHEIDGLLRSSALLGKLTAGTSEKPLFNVWRLVGLSEIPYANRLDYTRRLVEYAGERLFTGNAYALDKKDDAILPCYNAMIARSLIRLGCVDERIRKSMEWVLTYQPMNKTYFSKWDRPGVKKYGGCYRDTPCYIGIVKSIKALAEYQRVVGDDRIPGRIRTGVEYILEHEVAYRRSSGKPMTGHILDISFPESYNLNIVELLSLLKETDSIHDTRVRKALSFIERKKIDDEYWKINYAYKADGYICFDSKGKKADWVTYILGRLFHGTG